MFYGPGAEVGLAGEGVRVHGGLAEPRHPSLRPDGGRGVRAFGRFGRRF